MQSNKHRWNQCQQKSKKVDLSSVTYKWEGGVKKLYNKSKNEFILFWILFFFFGKKKVTLTRQGRLWLEMEMTMGEASMF